MDYKLLGSRIRNERQRLNLTQEKLAERVDISESFMGHIERGDRKLSLETLVRIAHELNVSTDYLLLGAIEVKPDAFLAEIVSNLAKQDSKQVNTFLNIIKTLADNMDKWAE